MTEREFFNQSVWNHIIDHDQMISYASAKPSRRSRGAKRSILLIAACFLGILITVACIPSARDEVLSWFGLSMTPGDYLGKASEAREQIEPVEALITQTKESNNTSTVKDTGALGSVSKLLAERLNCTPMETLYDGENIYVSMKLGGGFGVWLLENYTGGNEASVAIPPDELGNFFDQAVPESYLSGQETYYSHTTGRLLLTLPDGSVISGGVQLSNTEAYAALFDQIHREPQRANELTESFLSGHAIVAYAALKADPDDLMALADESGNLEGALSLLLQIETGDSNAIQPVTVLEADIGRAVVNVATYRTYAAVANGKSETAEWTGETTITHYDDSEVGKDTRGYVVFTNHVLRLDGLKMRALSVQVDATGIKDLQVEVTYPEHWTDEDIKGFSGAYGIRFRLLINGEEGDWTVNGLLRASDAQDAHMRIWHCRAAAQVPLGLLPEVKELTLIPYIVCRTAFYELLPDQSGELVIRGEVTPLVLDQPFRLWSEFSGGFDTSRIDYPQYALTFSIQRND